MVLGLMPANGKCARKLLVEPDNGKAAAETRQLCHKPRGKGNAHAPLNHAQHTLGRAEAQGHVVGGNKRPKGVLKIGSRAGIGLAQYPALARQFFGRVRLSIRQPVPTAGHHGHLVLQPLH